MADERISGKVVRVLNDKELVINRGSADGVIVGMEFAILMAGPELTDPDTGEPLGNIDIAKAVVKVVRVDQRFAVARSFRTKLTGGLTAFLAVRHELEILDVAAALEDEIDDDAWIISTGDRAIESRSGEYLPPMD